MHGCALPPLPPPTHDRFPFSRPLDRSGPADNNRPGHHLSGGRRLAEPRLFPVSGGSRHCRWNRHIQQGRTRLESRRFDAVEQPEAQQLAVAIARPGPWRGATPMTPTLPYHPCQTTS